MLEGRFDLAKGEAYKGIARYPNAPEMHYFMGMAKQRLNEEGWDEDLQKALDLGLFGEMKQRAEEALADQ
jgi:hypothetical protein